MYELLVEDPTNIIAAEITDLINEMAARGTFDTTTKEFLLPQNPRTSRFYLLPKIHKQNNPGRPIISSCGAPTEHISMFVDHHLRPLVEQLPSYLKDTNHFLSKLRELPSLPPGSLLATLDVKSLYTNIPHTDGLEASRKALDTRSQLLPSTEDLVNLASQILTNNAFTFAGQCYLQIHGTAMGTRMAPSYANIFMGSIEQRILDGAHKCPLVWWRFIDDIFIMGYNI